MAWSRESRQSRGYDSEWERVRALIVVRDKGLCQSCLAGGRVVIGVEVDHRMPKAECKRLRWSRAQQDHPSNLWLLCKECHKRKTAEENGRAHKTKVQIGADGWPLDNPEKLV
jgi:5-methylcytosine-specific restriction protein A